jgi:DNA polymerase-3 subunit beta
MFYQTITIMKFVVSSAELLDRLQLTSRVMSSKPIVEVLNNILFIVKDGKLVIMGTDLQTTLVSEIALPDVQEDGSLAVLKKIMEPLQAMPDQPITISSSEEGDSKLLTLKCSTGEYSFPYCEATEFPIIPEDKGSTKFSVSTATLNDGIGRTIFAIGNDDMRPAMNGVFFDIHADDLIFVATDAHRLVCYTRKDIKAGTESSFILPKKSAGVLKTVLAREADDTEISFNDESVSFKMPNYRLICRLIEGKFPAYSSVIPAENPNCATLNRADMLAMVRRVSMVSAETPVRFTFSTNQINIKVEDFEYSYKGEERLACSYEGDDIVIGFKAAYVIDMLSSVSSDEITIEMSQPERPGLIKPVGEDAEVASTLMLLMPIQLDNSY